MSQSVSRRAVFLATSASAVTLGTGAAHGRDVGTTAPVARPDTSRRYPDPTVPVATDGTGMVGYPINKVLPGIVVPDEQLGRVCLPFIQMTPAPPGYQGDYRVKEFSFAAAKKKLAQCRAEGSCTAVETAKAYAGVEFRVTGTVNSHGKIDPFADDVDLTAIRRPAFFGRAPYDEPIAAADARTYIFELAVPADLYDQRRRGAGPTTKVRGWYLQGAGVPAPHGRRIRALVIFIGGRTIETTALQDPNDPLYVRDADGKFVSKTYPNATTELWGARQSRQYIHSLNRAGFDVLTFDKRGHGISGGLTADNVLNQGLDMLRAIDALGTGDGLRVATPSGRTVSGKRAAEALIGKRSRARTMPILLGGASQGGYVTQAAMNANFNRWSSFDTPGEPRHAPWGHANVKGAILLANLWGQPYIENPDLALVAANAQINHFWFRPTSEPLANIGSWPAVFFGKGIWDELGQTAGTFDAYLRARDGHKELVYVRGPHAEGAHGPANVAYLQERMVEFAVRSVTGRTPEQKPFRSLREALAASPPIWEVSTQPTFQQRSSSTAVE
jgi:pimeloyl-ACP methyl ester carboxylesterase